MAVNKKVSPYYPYFVIDGHTNQSVDKQWQVVTLENAFITVSVLPEVGGKVMGAIEKSTGKEFVYLNHVMKFRAIGIRGQWTSGGIEHNFGLDLGHAPWAAAPVDYVMMKNADGSVSCVVGGLDLASRSEWRVKINLPKDKTYFETQALWFNPLPLHQAYFSWENAAFKATDDLQFYFPGNYHIGHNGFANPWPTNDKRRDLSVYKNNNFWGSKSYHVIGNYRNWFGGYWKNSSFGFGHWSSYDEAPGKKLWIWSLSRDGAIWEDLLTDNDGQYLEAQSGVKLNQAEEKSGYHSPYQQCVEKEPTHSEALARIAELYYREGRHKEGIPFAKKLLEFSTYEGAANFIFGDLQDKLNNLNEAEEALSVASRTMEFRSAAVALLAVIELKKKNDELALLYANKSPDNNKYNLTAANCLMSAYRKLNDTVKAKVSINTILQIDPLNHYACFEQYLLSPDTAAARASFQSGIQNEFPYETYLELAIQYVDERMNEEAIQVLSLAPEHPTVYYWLAYLFRNISEKWSDEYLNKAEAISPWLVFPFRSETLSVLEWAGGRRHSWKVAYYKGLIHRNNNNIAEAKQLFEQCGDEPDYAPFYISRGILFSDDNAKKDIVLKDFIKAQSRDPSQWRAWHALSTFYQTSGNFTAQIANAQKAYSRFSANPVISMDYAKALLNVKMPGECIAVLNNTLVLPQEGASEGHEIFEMAHLANAFNELRTKKYKSAIHHLINAKEFPENLGSGMPFDPDYRMQDYLLAYCEEKSGNIAKASQYYIDIIAYTDDVKKFNESASVVNNYITTLLLDKSGNEKHALELRRGWQHAQDSLTIWHIREHESVEMKWVVAKRQKNEEESRLIENEITGQGIETMFSIGLRAVTLVEKKQ